MKINQIVLASRPSGTPEAENFRFEEVDLRDIHEGEVLIQPTYFSVDPYMRGRMNDVKSYSPPYQLNEPILGGVVGKVIESKSPAFKTGEPVYGTLPWATRMIEKSDYLQKIDTSFAPASYYLGILGMPGLTAYFGLLDIGRPRPGETVVVSGAAGAVGSIVGQIARLKGCRVIGIAGTDEKVKMLKSEFSFDEVINYKTSKNLRKDIKSVCPDNVDVYFDNVGGEISDAVLPNINFKARVVVCGQISLYNETRMQLGPRFLPLILTNSALIKGYIIRDYADQFAEGKEQLTLWFKEGKLKQKETIIKGFEKLPEALLGLFKGVNQGKMVVSAE